MIRCCCIWVLGFIINYCASQFTIPTVKLEAFSPKGFRASIPDVPGIQLFAFHGRRNRPLGAAESGEFSSSYIQAENGFWTFEDPNLQLALGDKIFYWISVQHNRFGYRKEDSWMVDALVPQSKVSCEISSTVVNNEQNICKGALIFQDLFQSNTVDVKKWVVESYIPLGGPNYEFNSYQNSPDTINVANAIMKITPIAKKSDFDVRGVLDLRNGCTSSKHHECFHQHRGAQINSPVTSAKLRSKFTFKYGKIEIRAKLPLGEWVFPDISLVPLDNSKQIKLWVAYARGNKELSGNGGDEIGGSVLFGGPIMGSSEPKRSKDLRSRKNNVPYSDEFHTYTLIWQPGSITALVDNIQYGLINTANSLDNTNVPDAPFNSEFYLTLGVGVGGINDFPDGYKSTTGVKPWSNQDPKLLKDFFQNRFKWLSTWHENDTSLQIQYVTVNAI